MAEADAMSLLPPTEAEKKAAIAVRIRADDAQKLMPSLPLEVAMAAVRACKNKSELEALAKRVNKETEGLSDYAKLIFKNRGAAEFLVKEPEVAGAACRKIDIAPDKAGASILATKLIGVKGETAENALKTVGKLVDGGFGITETLTLLAADQKILEFLANAPELVLRKMKFLVEEVKAQQQYFKVMLDNREIREMFYEYIAGKLTLAQMTGQEPITVRGGKVTNEEEVKLVKARVNVMLGPAAHMKFAGYSPKVSVSSNLKGSYEGQEMAAVGIAHLNEDRMELNTTLERDSKGDRICAIAHEYLHLIGAKGGATTQMLRLGREENVKVNLPYKEWLNEGMTELLAQEATGLLREKTTYVSYPHETMVALYLRQIAGNEDFKNAYLTGDFTSVRKKVDELLGEGTFDGLVAKSRGVEAFGFMREKLGSNAVTREMLNAAERNETGRLAMKDSYIPGPPSKKWNEL